MDSLPVEILAEILDYLPPASRPSARLTSRPFHALLTRSAFRTLRAFLLDPDAAVAVLRAALHDLPARPRSLWSPECSVPDGLPLPASFLRAVCAALDEPLVAVQRRRSQMLVDSSEEEESSSDESEGGGRLGPEEEEAEVEEDGSLETILHRLERSDLDEQRLRQTLFRYALYKSYLYDGEGEAPQLWVMNSAKWKYQL